MVLLISPANPSDGGGRQGQADKAHLPLLGAQVRCFRTSGVTVAVLGRWREELSPAVM